MINVAVISEQPVLLRGFASILEGNGFKVAVCCTAETLTDCLPSDGKIDLAVVDTIAGLTFSILAEIRKHLSACAMVLWADALPSELIFKTIRTRRPWNDAAYTESGSGPQFA